ncbi:hypothetical protein BST61_g381 [Cercospora zeina]
MASIQHRDPRLNPNKRPPSRSPDGRLASNKRHAGDTTALSPVTHNGVGSSLRSDTNTDCPSTTTTLENFFEACTSAAALRLELQSAHRERERADREYSLLEHQFNDFPAIKEQKTAARTRAQQQVERIERKVSERAPEQRVTLNSLASLFNSSATRNNVPPPSAPSVLDGPSPLELQSQIAQLEEKVRALERVSNKPSAVDASEFPTRLAQLEKSQSEGPAELAALRKNWHSLATRVYQLSEESLKHLAAVETLSRDTSQAIDPLKKRCDAFGAENARLATESSKFAENVTNRLATLEVEQSRLSNAIVPLKDRVEPVVPDSFRLNNDIAPSHERVEAVVASRSADASSKRQSDDLAELERRQEVLTEGLDELRESLDELKTDNRDENNEMVKSVEEKITVVRKESTALHNEIKRTLADARDENFKYVNEKITAQQDEVNRTLADARDTLKQGISNDYATSLRLHESQVSERITAVQNQFAEARDVLDRNARDLVERLQRIEESQCSTVSTEQLDSLRKTVAELQEKLEKIESERVSKTQLSATRTPVWRPVLPSNDEDEMYPQTNGIPPTAANALAGRWSNDLEALKGIVSRHERQFNNFVTDEIVKQMVDQMTIMYPDAKSFHIVATNLRNEVTSIQGGLSALGKAVDSVVSNVAEITKQVQLLQKELGEETNKLKGDISNHTRRIEGCESMLEEGTVQLTNMNKLETDVRVLMQSVNSLASVTQQFRDRGGRSS